MAKLMSNREMALFRVAMSYCHTCQEWQHERGYGGPLPTMTNAAKEVANATDCEWDEDDIAECCEHIMGS